MRWWKTVFAVLIINMGLLGFTEGCGYRKAKMISIEQNENALISFLKNGQTKKSEVLSRFGKFQGQELENGRILMFVLDDDYRIAADADKSRFHLILVFDETKGWILRRHSLVRIR